MRPPTSTSLLVLLILVLGIPPSAALNPLFPNSCKGVAERFCVNIGEERKVGPFKNPRNRLRYNHNSVPSSKRISAAIKGTTNDRAYRVYIRRKRLSVSVAVPPLREYTVTIASFEHALCSKGGTNTTVTAEGVASGPVNVFEQVGCHAAYDIVLEGVRSNAAGEITVEIKGQPAPSVAGLCVERKLLFPSSCSQDSCVNYEGCGGLAVINASLAIPDAPCFIEPSAAASLTLPTDAVVQYAVLNWGASGHPRRSSTSLMFNGVSVKSEILAKNYDFDHYYTASAEVTTLVNGSGDYQVADMFHNRFVSCPHAHLAAWSLSVVYAAPDVEYSRINLCPRNTASTHRTHSFPVECMVPALNTQTNATLVAFEGETILEDFSINGEFQGQRNFVGQSGERFDVLDLNVTHLVNGSDVLDFQFSDDPSKDTLVLGVRATTQLLPTPTPEVV